MKNNVKYFLLMLISLTIVAGVYILGNMFYLPVFLVYLVISTVAICGYIWLVLKHNNEAGIAKMNGKEIDRKIIEKRKKQLKIYIIIFAPFVLTVLADSVYLVVLKDNPLFSQFFNLLAGNR